MDYINDCFTILQYEDINLSDARVVFDNIINKLGINVSNSCHLSANYIPNKKTKNEVDENNNKGKPKTENDYFNIHNRDFELGIIAKLRNEEPTNEQKAAISPLLSKKRSITEVEDNEIIQADITDPTGAFTDFKLGREKVRKVVETEKYIDLNFISPTSCIVERLFSQAKMILTPKRCAMTLEHLETQLFLKINIRFWDKSTVAKICK